MPLCFPFTSDSRRDIQKTFQSVSTAPKPPQTQVNKQQLPKHVIVAMMKLVIGFDDASVVFAVNFRSASKNQTC